MAALKTAYSKAGLSDKVFDGVASVIAKTVTEEKDIAGVVNSDETASLIQFFQSDIDRVRTARAQLQSEYDRYREEHPDAKPEPKPEPKNDPAIAELLERLTALEQSNREMGEKAAKREKAAAVRAKMKEQGSENDNILDLVLERADLSADSDASSVAAGLKAEYDATYRKFYGDGAVPQVHKVINADDAKKADEDFAARLRSEGKLQQVQK